MDEADEEECASWLNDDEFLKKYQMSRALFREVVDLIKDNDAFKMEGRGRPQRPVECQALVASKALGTEGSGGSNPGLRDIFATGQGTNAVYVNRVCKALTANWDKFTQWPDSSERKAIARGTCRLSGLVNCIGIVDGTLFPLAFCPSTTNSPGYKGRKHGCTLSGVIICDDKRQM